PAVCGKFVDLRSPGRACIIDEDVERGLALDDLGGQLFAARDRRDIDRQRDAFAAIFRRELPGGRLARPGLARGDVDLRRAVAEKSGRDHLADATRTARDKRNAALERKQILEHDASLQIRPPLPVLSRQSIALKSFWSRKEARVKPAHGITPRRRA